MANSLRCHGLQPARLLCPFDSPGKNTGVGCHCLLPGHLPDPGIEPTSPALVGGSFSTELPLVKFPVLHIWFTVGAKSILFKKKNFF